MTPRSASPTILRRFGPLILIAPLFQGACVDLWQAALVNGFFRGAAPVVQQALKDALGAPRAVSGEIDDSATKPFDVPRHGE